MRVTPIEALCRFIDLPRKTQQRHLQHQQRGQEATREFEEKLCTTIATREASTVVYTSEGKLKTI